MLMRLSSGKVSSAKARRQSLPTYWAPPQEQPNSRGWVVTQSKRHLPKPTQLALPSGSQLFLNRLLKSFFLQKLLGGLCVDAEQKNFWHLKKSSGIGSLFLPQLFLLKSLIQQELEISEEKTAKNIIAKSPSSQFICEHWSMPVSQADQSTDYFVFQFSLPKGLTQNVPENAACCP